MTMRTSALCVLLVGLPLLGLCACNAAPSERALQEADYGAPPASGHRDAIRAAFGELLLDPAGAQFEFDGPEKGWGTDGPGFAYGWVVWTRVNSKNQFGAFTGWQNYKVLLVEGAVHSIYEVQGDANKPKFRRVR
jgi:hypothetical protein